MAVEEWWWLYDVKRQKNLAVDYAGSLTQETVEDLYQYLMENNDD